MSAAIVVLGLAHRYGDHPALEHVDFSVGRAEMFGLLGPNGSGKTTLFRILSTLLPVQHGSVQVLGHDLQSHPERVRRLIGVTFQSPSLDAKLTVRENLKHQAHLYGLRGRTMRERADELLERMGLTARAGDRVETLSGGLKRRVEIAKGLLHDPALLLLDEPSTGLDPGARHDLWVYLKQLQSADQVTVLVTTHLMDEAEQCDRIGILHRGTLVALDTPHGLRESVGGDCVTIHSRRPEALARDIAARFSIEPRRVGEALRIERENGHEFVRDLVEAFPADVTSVAVGRPTLEDVFIDRTGHRFWDQQPP